MVHIATCFSKKKVMHNNKINSAEKIYDVSASRRQGPLFQFFTNAFVFFCRMGTVGDVKLKVSIHVDKSFLMVCV